RFLCEKYLGCKACSSQGGRSKHERENEEEQDPLLNPLTRLTAPEQVGLVRRALQQRLYVDPVLLASLFGFRKKFPSTKNAHVANRLGSYCFSYDINVGSKQSTVSQEAEHTCDRPDSDSHEEPGDRLGTRKIPLKNHNHTA